MSHFDFHSSDRPGAGIRTGLKAALATALSLSLFWGYAHPVAIDTQAQTFLVAQPGGAIAAIAHPPKVAEHLLVAGR